MKKNADGTTQKLARLLCGKLNGKKINRAELSNLFFSLPSFLLMASYQLHRLRGVDWHNCGKKK
jgi:hypothetical protein